MKNRATAILYTFAYMAIGTFTPYVAQYLSTLGFDGTQIGIVTATGTTVAILAVTFWGSIYNRRPTIRGKALLIAALCIGSACAAVCMKSVEVFALVLLFFAVMYFMQPPSISLIDSFIVSNGSKGDRDFGSKRAWGAVGFALGVFIGGRIAGAIDVGVIFYTYIICFLITAAALVFMSRGSTTGDVALPSNDETEESDHKGSKHTSTYRELLRDKRVRQLLICMFFMGGTNVANNTYFSFLYIEGGGTLAGVGIVMLLMVGSEVPFMAWCDWLSQKFTMQKTILIAMIISSARFILYGFCLPWWLLAVLFFTQGAVNGIILVEFVRYISRIAPDGCKSLAVSAYYVIGGNISTIVCQFVGGIILDSFGAAGVYMFFGLFNLAGTLLYVVFGLHRST